ncbi:MAG: hypothetical protein VX320_02970, partial [Candidatus Thermoplasmatota archaeon]|nr:hypothetical protein [Candidatus Thermoplasmatota archaeon]
SYNDFLAQLSRDQEKSDAVAQISYYPLVKVNFSWDRTVEGLRRILINSLGEEVCVALGITH